MLRLEVEEVTSILEERLLLKGFTEAKAAIIAKTFTETSLEGVYSHGINRFKRFIEDVDRKIIDPNASPEIISKFNGVQQWDGKKGPGILNALLAVDAAVHLSNHYGIGCVALKNTNHWMRGGTYGRKAAHSDCIFIGWTNTIANLPAWGAVDRRLGNNPLVMAVPGDDPAGGALIIHSVNAANPLTGSESRAGNFDHYNSFTDHSLRQILKYTGYVEPRAIALNLYVFYANPFNYVAWALVTLSFAFFRVYYRLLGKTTKIYTKKIGAIGYTPPAT